MVSGTGSDVQGAVQLQLLDLGGVTCQGCGQNQLDHPGHGRPVAPLQNRPSDSGHVSWGVGRGGGREDDGKPVLVGLPEEPVSLVHYLVRVKRK